MFRQQQRCSILAVIALSFVFIFITHHSSTTALPFCRQTTTAKCHHCSATRSRSAVMAADRSKWIIQTIRGGGGGEILHPTSLEELDQILEQSMDKLVVIDFYSNNCPPCEKVAPLFLELSTLDEFSNGDNDSSKKVVFIKVNVEEQPSIVAKYQVTGWPTFLFIKAGQVVTEIVGGQLAEATLYDWIKMLVPKE